ncbi:MAG TPA: DUF2934 domain-containing protein [candidate division WOR-3 bacterium]|uniref:DUF2934 domain-containing protein n=1 Tax=candidate division WOR-3 bacterium TaxID=2052148 RepID=A0A7V0T5W4_UNCW3|nr:DUF2934 domain-containing protein [candidate division WOR-3 bacterium]
MTADTLPGRAEDAEDSLQERELTESELRRQVQAKAKELYVLRGGAQGKDWDDWFEAERIVRKMATRRQKGR